MQSKTASELRKIGDLPHVAQFFGAVLFNKTDSGRSAMFCLASCIPLQSNMIFLRLGGHENIHVKGHPNVREAVPWSAEQAAKHCPPGHGAKAAPDGMPLQTARQSWTRRTALSRGRALPLPAQRASRLLGLPPPVEI